MGARAWKKFFDPIRSDNEIAFRWSTPTSAMTNGAATTATVITSAIS